MYGIMYGVRRTTIYLPDEMKAAIEREAARRGVTEAEVIRGAVEKELAVESVRREIWAVVPEGIDEELAGRVDEILEELGGQGLDS